MTTTTARPGPPAIDRRRGAGRDVALGRLRSRIDVVATTDRERAERLEAALAELTQRVDGLERRAR